MGDLPADAVRSTLSEIEVARRPGHVQIAELPSRAVWREQFEQGTLEFEDRQLLVEFLKLEHAVGLIGDFDDEIEAQGYRVRVGEADVLVVPPAVVTPKLLPSWFTPEGAILSYDPEDPEHKALGDWLNKGSFGAALTDETILPSENWAWDSTTKDPQWQVVFASGQRQRLMAIEHRDGRVEVVTRGNFPDDSWWVAGLLDPSGHHLVPCRVSRVSNLQHAGFRFAYLTIESLSPEEFEAQSWRQIDLPQPTKD